MSAQETYNKLQKEINEKIAELQKALKNHEAAFAKDDKNWGYVGDIGSINYTLSEFVHFVNHNNK
jgi:hypothetical protein